MVTARSAPVAQRQRQCTQTASSVGSNPTRGTRTFVVEPCPQREGQGTRGRALRVGAGRGRAGQAGRAGQQWSAIHRGSGSGSTVALAVSSGGVEDSGQVGPVVHAFVEGAASHELH